MKILTIGDLHMKDMLSYGDYIKDQRTSEKKEVLDFIVESSNDCEFIVFLGDNFDHKNNSAEVVKDFIAFVERFRGKEVYIISGNHEKKGNGQTAIDFMREVHNPKWHIMTIPTMGCQLGSIKVDFLPFMLRSELGVETNEELTREIMKMTGCGKILFHHHMVEGCSVNNMVITDQFQEPILPRKELEDKYELIVGGHIHATQKLGKTIVTGNVFNTHIGDMGKSICKIDVEDMSVDRIPLPGIKLYNLINPNAGDLVRIDTKNLVKVTITDRNTNIDNLKKLLSHFSAYILSEQYPNKREKVHFEEGAIDMDIDKLLKIYSDEKKVDLNKLMKGWEIIR